MDEVSKTFSSGQPCRHDSGKPIQGDRSDTSRDYRPHARTRRGYTYLVSLLSPFVARDRKTRRGAPQRLAAPQRHYTRNATPSPPGRAAARHRAPAAYVIDHHESPVLKHAAAVGFPANSSTPGQPRVSTSRAKPQISSDIQRSDGRRDPGYRGYRSERPITRWLDEVSVLRDPLGFGVALISRVIRLPQIT
jgi:hypothetical protein